MKKVIITLVTILVILIIVLCYINIKAKNEYDDKLKLQEELYLNAINNPGLVINGLTPSQVRVDNIFFTVEECIKTYIKNATENNNQILYSLLDYKYIDKNSITIDNVSQLFIKDASNNLNKTVEEYGISRGRL